MLDSNDHFINIIVVTYIIYRGGTHLSTMRITRENPISSLFLKREAVNLTVLIPHLKIMIVELAVVSSIYSSKLDSVYDGSV